ncbi:hypothetical protein HKD37_17G048274 [Glycine soja]
MDSKLDVILLKLNTMVPRQPSPSSSSAKSPPPAGTMLPLLPKPPPPAEITLPPLPMAASHLHVNAKHHAPTSDPRRAANHRFRTSPPVAASFPPTSTSPFPLCLRLYSGTPISTTPSSSPSMPFSSLPNGSALATIFIRSFLHPLIFRI